MRHKNFIRWTLLSGIITLILLPMSGFAQNSGNRNPVIDNIMTRTSVRSYLQREVEIGKIDTLVRAGMAAPTAMNRQPWHFVVINDRAVLDSLAGRYSRGYILREAPLAIAVCGDLEKAMSGDGRDFWIQDVSAASENILLAAHGIGLGAVWTGIYPSKTRCAIVAEALKLPENIVPLSLIVVGYPDSQPTPKNKYKPENVSFNYFGGKNTK